MKLFKLINILIIFLFLTNTVYAKPLPKRNNDKLDVILLLDASASMQVTDPTRLRDEGAQLFMRLLRPDDRLGIIEFAGEAKVFRPLSNFNEEQIGKVSLSLNSLDESAAYTNLLIPIQKALEILHESGRNDARRIIILFSDGKMDPAPNEGNADELTNILLNETLPEVNKSKISIYTLSLSKEADKELLSKIANATHGKHWFAPTPEIIHQSFADLFLTAKEPEMLPLSEHEFSVDEEVNEVTIYATRNEEDVITLITPEGETISQLTNEPNIKWYHGTLFDVITLRTPTPGKWELKGLSDASGFVAVMTDLKLNVDWPEEVTSGTHFLIQARLYDSRKPIVLRKMSKTIKYEYVITASDRIAEPLSEGFLVDDGSQGDKKAGDGIFSHEVSIENIGEYKIGITASAPTFKRFKQSILRVKPPMVELEVIKRDEAKLAHYHETSAEGVVRTPSEEYFRINLSQDAKSLNKLKVTLNAVDSNQNRFTYPVKHIDDTYEIETDILPRSGEYKITAKIEGRDRRAKEEIRSESKPYDYHIEKKLSEETEIIPAMPQEQQKSKTKNKSDGTGSFIIALILIILLIGGAGFAAYILLKKFDETQSLQSPEATIDLSTIEDLKAGMDALDEKAKISEVDLNDKMFAELRNNSSTTEGSSQDEPSDNDKTQPANEASSQDANNPDKKE